jgi:hypothetical protein
MRTTGIRLLLLAFTLLAFGCGNSDSANVDGNWVAVTTSNTGAASVTINFNMQEGTANGTTTPVTFTTFTFTPTSNVCFPNGANANATGTITAPVQPGGNRTMVVDLWSDPGQTGNHATINVTIDPSNNSASGSYSLTGAINGCNSDNGGINLSRA